MVVIHDRAHFPNGVVVVAGPQYGLISFYVKFFDYRDEAAYVAVGMIGDVVGIGDDGLELGLAVSVRAETIC